MRYSIKLLAGIVSFIPLCHYDARILAFLCSMLYTNYKYAPSAVRHFYTIILAKCSPMCISWTIRITSCPCHNRILL